MLCWQSCALFLLWFWYALSSVLCWQSCVVFLQSCVLICALFIFVGQWIIDFFYATNFFFRNLRLILKWFEHFKQQNIQKNQDHLLSNYPFLLSSYLFLKNLQRSRTFLHVVLTRIFAMTVHFLQFWLKKSFWEISIDRPKGFNHIYAEIFCRYEKHYQDRVLKMRSSKVIARVRANSSIFLHVQFTWEINLLGKFFWTFKNCFKIFHHQLKYSADLNYHGVYKTSRIFDKSVKKPIKV